MARPRPHRPARPADPSPDAGRGACIPRAGPPGGRLAPRLPGRAWHRLPQHPVLPARGVDHDHHPAWTSISHGTTQPGSATRPGAPPRRPSPGKQSGLAAGKRRTSPRSGGVPPGRRTATPYGIRQMHATMSATSHRAHPEPGRSPPPSPASVHAAARAPVPGTPGPDRPAAQAAAFTAKTLLAALASTEGWWYRTGGGCCGGAPMSWVTCSGPAPSCGPWMPAWSPCWASSACPGWRTSPG